MDEVLAVALHGPDSRPQVSRFKVQQQEDEQD
jgi:hypothetical protein